MIHHSQAPLLPPVRKQFAAPATAKPAAAAESAAGSEAAAEKAKVPRLKSAFVRSHLRNPLTHFSYLALC